MRRMNKASIKQEFKKVFKDQKLEIKQINIHKWGLFSITVIKSLKTKDKVGLAFGQTDWNKNPKTGVVIDKKIDWI